MKTLKQLNCVLALSLCLMSIAHAHRSWLLPTSSHVDSKNPVITIDGAISENLFEFDTRALNLDDISIIDPLGKRIKPEKSVSLSQRSSIEWIAQSVGTYRISLVQKNLMVSYTVTNAQGGVEQKRWRGSEEQLASSLPKEATIEHIVDQHQRLETFVSNKKPSPLLDQTMTEGLVLQPLDFVTEFDVNQTQRFILLLNGKPLANAALTVVLGGVKYQTGISESVLQSDAAGIIQFKPKQAGVYWLNMRYPQVSNDKNDAKPTADFSPALPKDQVSKREKRYIYSATIDVLPE